MRNHSIHHVVVTDEQRVVGILSSFDLLELVEAAVRFVLSEKKAGTALVTNDAIPDYFEQP